MLCILYSSRRSTQELLGGCIYIFILASPLSPFSNTRYYTVLLCMICTTHTTLLLLSFINNIQNRGGGLIQQHKYSSSYNIYIYIYTHIIPNNNNNNKFCAFNNNNNNNKFKCATALYIMAMAMAGFILQREFVFAALSLISCQQ